MQNNTPKYYYFITAIVVALFLILLNAGGYLNKPREIVAAFFIPVEETTRNSGKKIYDFFRAFTMVRDIREENTNLKLKNRELVEKLVQFNETKVENELFRKQLDILDREDYQFKMVDIVGRNPQNNLLYLLVNQGANIGLKTGMPVVVEGNCLVGKIIEVNETYSKVLLINDKNSKINVIVSSSRVSGVLSGGYGHQLLMDMISQHSGVAKKEVIITSGQDKQYPKGLVVGIIAEVRKFDNQIFQQAMIEPFFDIGRLETLFVITNYDLGI